jgi:hypothetical protein
LEDQSGPSFSYNTTDFSGNWLTKGSCFCFDYRATWLMGENTLAVKAPKLAIYSGANITDASSITRAGNIRASFMGYPQNADLKQNEWHK